MREKGQLGQPGRGECTKLEVSYLIERGAGMQSQRVGAKASNF